MIIDVTSLSEWQALQAANADKLVVVDCWATWCGPCKMIAPAFTKLADEYTPKGAVFVKVDVDKADEVAVHLKVQAMPTFLFFRGNTLVGGFAGADATRLSGEVKRLLQQPEGTPQAKL